MTPGHEQLRDCIVRGLDAAAERLAASSAPGSCLQLRTIRLGTLADLDPDTFAGSVSADRIAGVVQRFEGQRCGTALLALDPGDALQWLRAGGDDDPLDRFVLLGGHVLCAVVEELARACDAAVQFGSSLLEERPLMAALLSTHAPSDTALLSLAGEIEYPGAAADPVRVAYTVQLLLDPKLLDGVLQRLRDPS